MLRYRGERTVKELKDELDETRVAVLSLMPADINEILGSYDGCESEWEAGSWEYAVANEIIKLAAPLQSGEGGYADACAHCPLCNDGSSYSDQEGFTLPVGLLRHLLGHGPGDQCKVFKVALALAKDYWCDKFHGEAIEEERQKQERILNRRKTEVLYRVEPDLEPKLVDEGVWGKVRDEAELKWAEQRLIDLGFSILVEANVKTYISDRNS